MNTIAKIVMGTIVLVALFSGYAVAVADNLKADPFFVGPDKDVQDFNVYNAAFMKWVPGGADVSVTVPNSGRTFTFTKAHGIDAFVPLEANYLPPELNTSWFQNADAYSAKLVKINS